MSKPKFTMQACNSSQVGSFGYDAESKTLAVTFKSGGTYHYHGVTADDFEDMKTADSVGGFLGRRVKGKYPFTKQEEKQK